MSKKPNNTSIVPFDFDGHVLVRFVFRDRPAVIVANMGECIGYTNGTRLVTNIGREWADEFIMGHDIDMIEGPELATLKELVADHATSSKPLINPHARAVMIAYESGADLILVKTSKPAGKRLRRFLVDKVMPRVKRDQKPLRQARVVIPVQSEPSPSMMNAVYRIGKDLFSRGVVPELDFVNMQLATVCHGPIDVLPERKRLPFQTDLFSRDGKIIPLRRVSDDGASKDAGDDSTK